jgi:acetyl esterase/lipase
MPPTLLLHGQADTRVLPFHTQRFTQALQSAGNPVTTRFYPGIDHVRIVASLAAPLRRLSSSYNDVQAFLSQY